MNHYGFRLVSYVNSGQFATKHFETPNEVQGHGGLVALADGCLNLCLSFE